MSTFDSKSKIKSYQIIIQEKLNEHWSDWFGEMEMTVRGAEPIPSISCSKRVKLARIKSFQNVVLKTQL